jgi:HEAT repeat protein
MRRGQPLFFFAGLLAAALAAVGSGQQLAGPDEQLLKAAGVPTDNEGLLQFFRHRSLKDGDRALLTELVRKLDSGVFKERDDAMRELTLRGPAAVPFLKEGSARKTSLESVRRCEQILRKIESGQGPEHPAAAARLLAARGAPGAVEALFNYLPYVTDEWIEEEVMASLGALTVQPGKMDPVLSEFLKDTLAGRRAAAAYVLGRRADFDQRELVRFFLADPDEQVRQRAAQSLAGRRPALSYKDLAPADENLLKGQGLGTDEPALLDVLRKRTLSDDDQRRLRQLIADLGAPAFAVRSRASKLLVKEGTPALAFLRPALQDPDAEVMRRANLCIEEIRRGPGPALPQAAVRLLARPPMVKEHSPAAAIRVLLAYAPFADDEAVEEEVATALTILSAREVKIDPLLPEALHDPHAARRGVAAHVLGRVGTREHRAGLRRLLDDPVPTVRLRAAQGLLLAKDRTAVPRLIALLNEVPSGSLWHVEEVLQRLAGTQAPVETVAEGTPEKRQKAVKAWDKWFAAHGSTLDLGRLNAGEPYLGLITVCEYDSAVGQPGGQVWEASRDGKQRWKIGGVLGAMDAQVLPNGRVLVAENSANRVTERDLSGAVKWEYRTPGNPIACQRLANGNTFIATYNQVMEITPDNRQLYLQTRGPQFYIFSARKTREGLVVAMTAQGAILRFDPLTNKDYPTVNLGPNGGWCSVEALPNGRFLVATMNNGQVREIDAGGTTHWNITMQGAFRATRLPNGNTLVASMTTRLVTEYDRNGNKRWEKTCEGRPWSVRYR